MAVITVSVVLFGITGMLGRAKIEELKDIRRQQQDVRSSIERNQRLVEQRDKWNERMEKFKGMMPVFPKKKRMDVYWGSEMEKLASRHSLKIIRQEVGQEHQEGPIYELPIECRDWEGTLASLVHFLFDLQSKGAMLDIRYLRIKPKNKTIRKGRFSLYCAYMRDST
jgi:Tfp pilus assembly protein PilO